MTQTASATVYVGGVPTGPDVKRLMDYFGTLERNGRVLKHTEIESLLGVSRNHARYRTVIEKFKGQVFDHYGVVLSGKRAIGEGYRCLTGDEVVEEASRNVRATGKRLRQRVLEVQVVPDSELSEIHLGMKRKFIHLSDGILQRHLAAQAMLRDVALLPSH